MRRRITIVLLGLGMVLGYGGCLARMHQSCSRWSARRAAFESHVADVCADAALRARSGETAGPRVP